MTEGCLVIMTSGRDLKPSQKWMLEKEIVSKFGVIAAVTESFEHDTKQLYLKDVQDESFKWVDYILHNPTYNMSLLDTELLWTIFRVCDYLDIQDLQCSVARQLAKRMNCMDTNQMKQIIAMIKNK